MLSFDNSGWGRWLFPRAKTIVTLVLLAVSRRLHAADPRALLDQYCIACHNQQARIAGLALNKEEIKANVSSPSANPALWEKVIQKLRAGAMPPAGSPHPPQSEISALISTLETQLDQAAALKPNPGRFILHRLNRTEYANAIRDLLALDIDPAALLPPDDESYGFDNIADVLGLSPALLEQYVSTSRKIAALALGAMSATPSIETYGTRPDFSQDQPIEGLPPGTRGGLLTTHNFPLDADYTIKAILARNSVEVTRGLEEPHQVEIMLDGLPILQATVGGKADTELATKNPAGSRDSLAARLQVRAHIKAGPHQLAATFVQKDHAESDTLLQPFLRTTLDPVNEVGLPHLEKLIVAGPYNATSPGDTPSRRRILSCEPLNETCATQILSTLARRAYRRPVTDADLQPLLNFYRQGGLESALRLILSSPQFLFRLEPEPAALAAGSVYRIDDLALASRLSFFLWSSIPDEALLTAAEQGKLKDPSELASQVKRMLADPRSSSLVTNFAEQWLFLRNLRAIAPDPRLFPHFDDNLRQSMRRETDLFVASIIRCDRDVADFLNADYTYIDGRLARHYGIPNIYGSRFRRIAITDHNRRGLLGQASILAVTSYSNRTSPTLRGKWILTNLIGAPPPAPPPNTPPLKENTESAKPTTVRARLEEHRRNPACAGCHATMDPLGFALENFDAVGQWHPSPEATGPASLHVDPDRFAATLTEKLMTFALGRGLDYNDAPAIRHIAQGDHHFSALILGIVQSPQFQLKRKM